MNAQYFDKAYWALMADIMNIGVTETNARTATDIRMLKGGHSFRLDLSDSLLPVSGNRKYYPHIAAAETAWQFMGTKDPGFILKHAPKLWSKFVETEEDYDQTGHPSGHKDVLKTAYGWRWRRAFGRDQLQLAVKELADNPTNRQLWVQAWDPARDGLGGPQPKNVPCPIGFSVSRIKDDVHMSVFIRSSDVFVGLPYDVMGYALTLDAIAATVDCTPGSIHFTLAHPHIYEPHWDATRACVFGINHISAQGAKTEYKRYAAAKSPWPFIKVPLPGWSVDEIVDDPEGYVRHVRRLAKRVDSNPWDPYPELVE